MKKPRNARARELGRMLFIDDLHRGMGIEKILAVPDESLARCFGEGL
jgi:hypothetical protein